MVKRWVKMTVALAVIVVTAVACGTKEYKPAAVNEETAKCVICNMSVKDIPYTTQLITTDGQTLMFDDIGCMNEWKTENGTDTVGAEFVRDHRSGHWIKYEQAYYAYDATFKTPMAYGIVAFEDEASAQGYIKEQGTGVLMTAEQLADHSWAVNRDMMDMGGMHSHDGDMHEESMHDSGKEDSEAHGEESAQEGQHS